MSTKYIFVTGGVCSSLGKGIATASIGALLKASGFKVFTMKLDPYLNVDPGTMSPFQHGEVFVLDDGAETDLDLGHYERFVGENLSKLSSVTTGKVYSEVIASERKGSYLGGTIQIIPHITNAIKKRITDAGKKSKADVVMVEIGGTTGDIEGLPYLEAIRQLRHELGYDNTLFVHLTLLPYLAGPKELKTKPTQASVRELRATGIHPDFILARADHPIKKELLKKIALFCDVEEDHVIPAPTVSSIYEVPLKYEENNLAEKLGKRLNMGRLKPKLTDWKKLNEKIKAKRDVVTIALVGKYTGLDDSYLSVLESLKIACYHQKKELNLVWVDAEKLEKKDKAEWEKLDEADGIITPGGFGIRGTEGMIMAATYCRENKKPYLGLCLGMQILTIEFARHALCDKRYTSEEFDEEGKIPKKFYAIHFLPDQYKERDKGGTLRLGSYPCKVTKGTKIYDIYGKQSIIHERHRHRYEYNNALRKDLEKAGLVTAGIFQKGNLVEMVELKDHPYMLGCQFHPEFLSRPHNPHPLFFSFIQASAKHKS
ncbi:CTP synthase [Candidatus Peregrinibacteria bacterium]|nr:CTP synthase [Candidatus Peregrinibacteria bacterium]